MIDVASERLNIVVTAEQKAALRRIGGGERKVHKAIAMLLESYASNAEPLVDALSGTKQEVATAQQ